MELMRSRSLTAGVMGMRSSIVLIMWIGHNFEVATLCWDDKECGAS